MDCILDNPEFDPEFEYTQEDVVQWRESAFAAKPYPPDAEHYYYFDRSGDEDRESATRAIYLLKCAGLWTLEDEALVIK